MVARSLSEEAFQGQIVRYLKTLGFSVYHTLDSRGSERGFYDLTIIDPRATRLILAELKQQEGKNAALTTDQIAWLDRAALVRDSGNSGLEVYGAVRPLDSDAFTRAMFEGRHASGALHQWCLSATCGRCTEERSKVKPSYRTPRQSRMRRR